MNIVVIDPPLVLTQQALATIKKLPAQVKIYDTYAADQDELYERGESADILLVDITTEYKQVLRRWPRLKAIVTTSVGLDHIDLAYCAQKNIHVVNFPGFNARAVAEMTLANLITLLRRIPAAQRHVIHGGWEFQYFEGEELSGKTMGIVGAGNIGRELINIARGLGMQPLVHTQHPSAARAKELGLEKFYSLHEVLKQSDFVVLAIPATAQTQGMIGTAQLRAMKHTAILVNCARWQIVDPLALAEAIYERRIAGAALDIVAREPFDSRTADPRLQEMINSNNVILTPHIAFNTKESTQRLSNRVLRTLTELVKT